MTLWNKFARMLLLIFSIGIMSNLALAQTWGQYDGAHEQPTVDELSIILVDSYGSYSSPFHNRKKRRRPVMRPLTAKRVISPSAAYQAALISAPGSQGLGVRYLQALRGYVVRLRSGGRVYRVFVDGRTGRVMRR